MNFRRQILRPGRVLATLAGFAVAWPVLAGEAIHFSKPAVPLAAPPRAESNLPEIRERGLDFSNPNFDQAPAAPVRQTPPMMRNDPRNDEEERTHRFLRTPKMFTDPEEEKARKEARQEARNNPLAPAPDKLAPSAPFTKDMSKQIRSDEARSLSPVTDLDWQPGQPANRQKESRREEYRREGSGAASPFTRTEEAQFGREFGRPTPFIDFSSTRPQEQPTPAQIQRRTDFEQLLNPNAGRATKGPDSLQPVVNAAEAKPGSLAVPTASGFDPRSADPMATFNRQQERLRGPVIEDVNKRYNAAPANGPGGSSATANQPTVNRQPLSREFPARRGL